jgi:hypothetical protein
MLRVLLAVSLLMGSAAAFKHNATLNTIEGNPCFKLSYDAIYYSDGLTPSVYNASIANPSDTVGNCSQLVPIKETTHSYTAYMTFSLLINTTQTLNVTLTFAQNATYSASGAQLTGDKTASLTGIVVNSTAGPDVQNASFTFAPSALVWNMAYNSSFLCSYNFTYTNGSASVPAKVAPSISIINLQVQPFMPPAAKDFDAPGNSASCPGSSGSKSTKIIGLIVGGVLTGLALIGIVGFAISRCRTDRAEYESI